MSGLDSSSPCSSRQGTKCRVWSLGFGCSGLRFWGPRVYWRIGKEVTFGSGVLAFTDIGGSAVELSGIGVWRLVARGISVEGFVHWVYCCSFRVQG